MTPGGGSTTPYHPGGNHPGGVHLPIPRAPANTPAQSNSNGMMATPSSATHDHHGIGGFSPASQPLSSVRDRIGVFEKTGHSSAAAASTRASPPGTTPYKAAAVLAAQQQLQQQQLGRGSSLLQCRASPQVMKGAMSIPPQNKPQSTAWRPWSAGASARMSRRLARRAPRRWPAPHTT